MTSETVPTHRDCLIEIDSERALQWRDLQLSTASIEQLRTLGTHDEADLATLELLAVELSERLDSAGAVDALQGFVADAEDHRSALDRLAAIHTIEVLEGRARRKGQREGLVPVPWPGWVDADDPHRVKRRLTDLELGLVRLCSLQQSAQHASTIVCGECSATAGELPAITSESIDTDRLEVLLPGGVDDLTSRVAAIPAWGRDALVRRAEVYRGTGQRLLYGGGSTDLAKIQSSISMNAKTVFNRAGIGGDPAVSFGSLRHTIARQILDTAGTDKAVAFLGESNYELVRIKLGVKKAAPQRRRAHLEAA